MSPSRRGRAALAAAIIFLVAELPYLPTLGYPFVWDDHALIETNPFIQNARHIPEIFKNTIWGQGEHLDRCRIFYRPLILISYMVDFHLWKLRPWGYHLTNVLGHGAASVLAFLFLRTLTAGIAAPAAAALLFALHPTHTESVAWISGRTDVLCAIFYFLSLVLFRRATQTEESARPARRQAVIAYTGALGAFLLALAAKEMALSLPLVLVLGSVVYPRRDVSTAHRADWAAILPFFLLVAAYVTVRVWVLGSFSVSHFDLGPTQFIASVSHVLWKYARILVLPVGLDSHYPDQPVEGAVGAMPWIGLAVLVALAAGAAFSFRRARGLAFALGWVGLTLVPVLHLGSFGEVMLADRFLYIPSLGAAYGLAVLALGTPEGRLVPIDRRKRAGEAALVGAVAIAFCLLTVRRDRVWEGDLALFTEALKTNPDSAYVRASLGLAYSRLDRDEEALAQYEGALRYSSGSALVYVNAGVLYQKRGDLPRARSCFQGAIRARTDDPSGYLNLANLSREERRLDEAMTLYRAAIERNPFSGEAQNGLGLCLVAKGRFREAVDAYRRAIEIDSNLVRAWTNLGVALFQMDEMKAAAQVFEEAGRLDPASPAAHGNLAGVLLRLGEAERALAEYEEARRLDPANTAYRLGIAAIQLSRGDGERAAEILEQSVRLDPRNGEAWLMLGMAREAAKQPDLAAKAYRTYLARAPAESPVARKVQARLQGIETASPPER